MMPKDFDRLVEIIEERAALELGLRIVLEAAESKELPPEGTLPCFSSDVTESVFMSLLERVTGKKYRL